jgi:hypothetical protein
MPVHYILVGNGEKPNELEPSTFPSGCYASPSAVVIFIALHVYGYYCRGKHVVYIASNQNSDYVVLGQREVDRDKTWGRMDKSSTWVVQPSKGKRALVVCKRIPLPHFGILTVNNLLNQTFKIYKHQSTFRTFPQILVEEISEGFKF